MSRIIFRDCGPVIPLDAGGRPVAPVRSALSEDALKQIRAEVRRQLIAEAVQKALAEDRAAKP